jgi:hypothetical protein
MSIVCYVEDLSPDKRFGSTINLTMIAENMNKFKIVGLEPGYDYSAFVFQAGRYLAVVAGDSENKKSMSFLDLQNNENLAKTIATKFEEALRRLFMKNFYVLSPNYKKNYDLVSLEVAIKISDN